MSSDRSSAAPAATFHAEQLTTRIGKVNRAYARFYGPMSLLVMLMSFFPYYSPGAESTTTYGNLWQEVLLTGHDTDVFALVVLLLTAGLLVPASVGRASTTGLIGILTGSIIIGCTLLQSPGYVNPPALTIFGFVDIVLSFLIASAAVIHAFHLFALDLEFQQRLS